MGTIRFNKDLPGKTHLLIIELEGKFSLLLEHMTTFKQELDRHTGKAAISLQDKMVNNLAFFSKASSSLLYFADTVLNFVKAVEAVDESTGGPAGSSSRAEINYTFSTSRIEDEVKLTPASLKQATDRFEGNMAALDEVLGDFHTLLDHVMFDTEFPWGDVADIWPEAKQEIFSIVGNARNRLEDLLKSARLLTEELQRVDNLISRQLVK